MSKEKRIKCIDCTRAICMLWIVGIWHMNGYLKTNIIVINEFTSNITIGVLGTFTFLSGFFSSKKIYSKKDVLIFYEKKIIRIFPLFFLSCTSLFIASLYINLNYIISLKQYILTLIGLSNIILPAPETVWFVSMLILFYFFTPIFNCSFNTLFKMIIGVSIFVIFNSMEGISKNIILYYPIYVLGLILKNKINLNKQNKFDFIRLIIMIVFWIFVVLIKIQKNYFFLNFINMYFFINISLYLGRLFNKNRKITELMERISYASLFAYLFHRQFYGLIKFFIGDFSLFMAYIIILPIFIVISYISQKQYDKVIYKIKLEDS